MNSDEATVVREKCSLYGASGIEMETRENRKQELLYTLSKQCMII